MPPWEELLRPVTMKYYRAQEHLETLEAEIERFSDACNRTVATKDDLESVQRIYYLPQQIELPEAIPNLIGDIVGNLRSSLDRLAYAACMQGLNGQPLDEGRERNIAFPVAKDAAKYGAAVTGQIQGLPKPVVIDAFRTLEPYPGGKDEGLFILHGLTNTDKHRLPLRLLYLPKISYGSEAFDDLVKRYADFERLSKIIKPEELPFIPFGAGRPHAEALNAGDELLGAPLDSKIDKDVKFRFDVSIDERGFVKGLPAVSVLSDISVTAIQAIRAIGAAMDV